MWTSRRAEWIILAILLTLGAAASTQRKRAINATAQDDIDDFVPYQGERFNIFDWNIFQNVAKSHKGNLLISPISLKLALVLLYEGAQGETGQELATVMHLPVGRPATRDKFSTIIKSLQETSPQYTLNLGTRIFLDQSILPRQRYGAIAKNFYSTEVINTNFSDAVTSADIINNFVKNVTNSHIKTIIDDASRLKESLMVIASAMFFKGTWYRQPFKVQDTRIGKFYTVDRQTIDVPYMRSSSKFYLAYADELDAKILRLPYAGQKYSMFIILPSSPGKLDQVLNKITPFIINKHVWLMQEVGADLMIPKFKFDFTSHLEKNLREVGIRDIFDDTAILTGILRQKSTSRRLIVSDILQKAGIEVTEEGTVAFAATEIEIGNKVNDETFHATHPFLFYIEDESTGTILYMGLVNNPLVQTGTIDPSGNPLLIPNRFGEQAEQDLYGAGQAFGTSIEDRQNFFNIELLQELNQANPGNIIVGTTSIKNALMILAEAAAGQTRQQIVSTLRLPSDSTDLRNIATYTINPFKDQRSNTELQTAIKLWLAQDVTILQNYTDALQQFYKGELQKLNFRDVAGSTNTINNWVKLYTHGRINSIIDPATLQPDTKMILTTAVYFKGTWLNAFDKKNTRLRCFNVPKLGCLKVPLMETIANFKYAQIPALDAEVVTIPYTGERVSMIIMLPRRLGEQALKDLSRDLAFTPLSAIISQLKETELLLQIPRFCISNKMDLRFILETLGIQNLFGKNADLTLAFPAGNVQVGAVMHNAMIEVAEEGTIAAAVTGSSVIPLMGQTTTTFRADRPFIFFLYDHQANSVLFAGRYAQPEAQLTYY